MTRAETEKEYIKIQEIANKTHTTKGVYRELALQDLYFMLVVVLKNEWISDNPKLADWTFARCREVQANPDGYMDLWAREHMKSTIITFAKTIQDILSDPEKTWCIFSATKPLAKKHFNRIKRELEANETLKFLFPDILYHNPRKEASRWSEEKGIEVKRQSNKKEATLEAWGLVDGQPTGAHFDGLIYDDVVTRESVTTADMITKVTEATALSFNLGAEGGIRRGIGTIYHYNDTNRQMIERGAFTPRIYTPCRGKDKNSEPWFWSREVLAQKIRDMGDYVASCQLFQNPQQEGAIGFREEWINYWQCSNFKNMNIYIVCDPASEKKKTSDYTVFWVIGLGSDRNYYVIDCVRDKVSLTEKGNILFSLYEKYSPKGVGYEKVGMQSDIEYFKERMERQNYRFHVTPLPAIGGKNDRIMKLIPLFEEGRVYLPTELIRFNYKKEVEDLIKIFKNNEYKAFPFAEHDDMLDALQMILHPDLRAMFPETKANFDAFKIGNSQTKAYEEFNAWG